MARIYLSSTFEDLREFRRAVYDALRELRHDVVQMEHYTASEQRPLRECLDDVSDSDLYVGIFAWRYGYVPVDAELNPNGESITALEYRAAKGGGTPTFVFLTDDNSPWPKKWIDTSTTAVDELRAELMRDQMVARFQTPDELARKVASAITKWERRQAPVKLDELLPGKPDVVHGHENATWGVIASGATRSPFTGAGVTLAIVSTGLNMKHPAFTGIEFTFKDFTGHHENDPQDFGTHSLATVCGRDVDGRRIGVARGISRVLVAQTLRDGTGGNQSLFDGIAWAAREGAHIILVQAGIDFSGQVDRLVQSGLTPQLAAARALESHRVNLRLFEALATVCSLRDGPCLLIAPSGNESSRDLGDHVFESALPAGASGFLSVAALTRHPDSQLYDIATFSNRGEVAAPGVDIESAIGAAGLRSMSGTSMAASHAAGVAALWAQKLQQSRGGVDTRELAARVRGHADTSTLVPGLGADDVGCGLVQAPRS